MTDRRQPDHRVGRAAGALLGRRRAWTAAALAGALLARPGGGVAQAQPGWPERPVRIVVPIAPGGPMDLIARSLAEKLFETWRQPVIVENRPGAGTAIGTEHVARAAPDGYTLLLAAVAHVMNPPLLPRLPYDPVRDFTPILQVATQPMVLAVHPTVPAETLAAFVALARARGAAGQPLALGSAGVGASSHLAAALFGTTAGFAFTHVPYAGAAPLLTALLAGEVQGAFLNSTVATQQVRAGGGGRLRALAATSTTRWRELPEVPTVAEMGWPDYEASAWYGFLAPAGLPASILDRLHRDIAAALRLPEVRARLMGAGLDLLEVGPERFGALIAEDLAKWTRVVRAAGLRAD